jgi:hypothetical protein
MIIRLPCQTAAMMNIMPATGHNRCNSEIVLVEHHDRRRIPRVGRGLSDPEAFPRDKQDRKLSKVTEELVAEVERLILARVITA